MTPQDQAKARLRAYLAHFIDHAQDHVAEIDLQRSAIGADSRLGELLDQAVADVQLARRSLEAALEAIGGSPARDVFSHHAHSHQPHLHHSPESVVTPGSHDVTEHHKAKIGGPRPTA
ncbi:hypothetical protein HNR60_004721 [Rhodopseudomonas rhenobacensis]|uniref:DUF8180 domain-containing protein n=1 Tax=Rhodopseudomonas rhenobacensis TaxID=87461 RepID=A0A7W7Z8E8_9BRAD|nr:hypothetical protein [Rhodopseudomonas rhenobacensis]MBB5049936.1 hypothetical protein [Rhodopseudomonas rhenobacensis]